MWSQVRNRNTVSPGGLRPSAGSTVTVGTLVKGFVSLVVLASMWFFLAPSQLGGSSSYVITYGTSMAPAYHAGDLAVVRASGSYHVGEIIADLAADGATRHDIGFLSPARFEGSLR